MSDESTPTGSSDEPTSPAPSKARRKRRGPGGETLGGILVGFDQQILRSTPPVQELVRKGSPVRGLSGEDGGTLQVRFPDDPEETDDDPADGEEPSG